MKKPITISALLLSLTSLLADSKDALGYVTLLNPFTVSESETSVFLSRWKQVAEYMRTQPGFVESELHQGIEQKDHWVNYAKWKTADDFYRAVSTPQFKELTENFPGEGRPTLYSVQIRVK